MKLVLSAIFVLGLGQAAFAGPGHEHGKDHNMGKTFAERKTHMQTEIDQRLTQMTEHKACVGAAADDAALKACHEKMHEKHMEKRMDKMEARKERMEKRMDKMKEKMEKKSE